MIESEGITEEVKTWRTDVVADIARDVGLEKVIFEAANPEGVRVGTSRSTARRSTCSSTTRRSSSSSVSGAESGARRASGGAC